MPNKKASEFREKDSVTLIADVEAARQELFNLKLGYRTGSVSGTHVIRQKQKDIARMLTILREREIATEIAAQEDKKNGK
jgi:large subunit ribosomal protein L29